jgi:hypothetical protein
MSFGTYGTYGTGRIHENPSLVRLRALRAGRLRPGGPMPLEGDPPPLEPNPYPCLDCGAQLEEGVLLCVPCLEKRQKRKVIPFGRDARRRRTAAVLTRAKVIPFPARPPGTHYRPRLGRDYVIDAVRDGEPCPVCQGTDWRLVSAGLWLCNGGHYWSPRRQVEKPDSDPALPSSFESGDAR